MFGGAPGTSMRFADVSAWRARMKNDAFTLRGVLVRQSAPAREHLAAAFVVLGALNI